MLKKYSKLTVCSHCLLLFIVLDTMITANLNAQPENPYNFVRKGLVGYWKFDEGNGHETKDHSGLNNNGIIHGADWTIDGIIGTALYFDGINDHVQIKPDASLNLTNNFTVSVWFKCEGNEAGLLVSKGVYCSSPRAWSFSMKAEFATASPVIKLGLFYSKDGSSINSAEVNHETLEFWNAWHHGVMVFQKGTAKFYDNGKLMGIVNLNQNLFSNNKGIRIGNAECNEAEPSFAFKGIIDEIRLYNRALSDREVLDVYQADLYNSGQPIVDNTPPSVPTEIYLTSSGFSNRIDLKWKTSTDNFAVEGYRIFRIQAPALRPIQIVDLPATDGSNQIFSDLIEVNPSASYTYLISAYDIKNNESRKSKPVSIRLPATEILPVFPAAQGFGIATPAGRGGKIIKVTNLNADGEGSLKAAIDSKEPRVIVFEVSGTINFDSHLTIWNPFVTIAGQTAPSPGITIKNAVFRVFTHDVLVQHLRIRVGDEPNNLDPTSLDGLTIGKSPEVTEDVYNVVIDHCSISWAIDENVDFGYNGTHDITISNCIISEGLFRSTHPKETHSKGLIIQDSTRNIAVIGNLFAHNDQRNPSLYGFSSSVIVNNLVYNPGYYGMAVIGNLPGATSASFVGNVVIPGLDSDYANRAVLINDNIENHSRIYVFDNLCKLKADDPWSAVLNFAGPWIRSKVPPVWADPLKVIPGKDVKEWVLNHAGARPADRDAVDDRIIKNIIEGTGRIINSQSEVGGWPELEENYRALQIPANPNADDDNDGYTNLEEWLHQYAKLVEERNL